MFRKYGLFLIILSMIFSPLSTSYGEDGYFGENPGLDFYSMIEDGSEKMQNGLIQKRLEDFGTYGNLTRTCRTGAPWLDSLRIDERLLKEASAGTYTQIMMIAQSKNVSLTTDSIAAIVNCLQDRYRDIQLEANKELWTLQKLGSLGLYMDGDASNSDYDIITDIEKINTIIFSEDLKYRGSKNTAKSSFNDLLSWKPIRALFGEDDTATGNDGGNNGENSDDTISPPLSSVGIGSVCRADGAEVTSVTNLMNDDFLNDLANTLSQGNDGTEDSGNDYGMSDETDDSRETQTSASDFFHKIPCDGIFCIDVKLVSGSKNLLGGGEKRSIEGMLDRHTKIMTPIAGSNLAAQIFTKNTFESALANHLKFGNLIPKPLIYMSCKPQVTRRDKKYDTEESKNAKLLAAYKCAAYFAWLSSDPNIANSTIGWSYGVREGVTPTNIGDTTLPLWPTDPDQNIWAASCVDVALFQWRSAYYNSFSNDLTEIASYTAGMICEIDNILLSGYHFDTLTVQWK
jgi:hypothetical protein